MNRFFGNSLLPLFICALDWKFCCTFYWHLSSALIAFYIQVFAGGWSAVFVSLDNVGVWNLRTENLDRWYLGQETYMRIINPEDTGNKTELPAPDNVLYCGALGRMQKYRIITSPQAHMHIIISLACLYQQRILMLFAGLRELPQLRLCTYTCSSMLFC